MNVLIGDVFDPATFYVAPLIVEEVIITHFSYVILGFFGHFEKDSRRIPKKLKQFSSQNSSKFVKNSMVCQLKTNFLPAAQRLGQQLT